MTPASLSRSGRWGRPAALVQRLDRQGQAPAEPGKKGGILVVFRVQGDAMQPYTPTFFAQLQAGALQSARAVVPHLLELLHPRSVVDVGCGLGAWLAVFREQGLSDVLGI